MKRRPQGSLSLSKAIPGFLQFKAAEGLSPNTLQSYQRDLKLWQIYVGDIPARQIDDFAWRATRQSKRHPRSTTRPVTGTRHAHAGVAYPPKPRSLLSREFTSPGWQAFTVTPYGFRRAAKVTGNMRFACFDRR